MFKLKVVHSIAKDQEEKKSTNLVGGENFFVLWAFTREAIVQGEHPPKCLHSSIFW